MDNSMLEAAIKDIKGAKIVPKEDWVDSLSQYLKEEGLDVKWKGDILLVEKIAEIAHIKVDDILWQVCYDWVPLWRMRSYADCFANNWRAIYPTEHLFAIPDEDEELGDIDKKLRKAGFQIDSFEGF